MVSRGITQQLKDSGDEHILRIIASFEEFQIERLRHALKAFEQAARDLQGHSLIKAASEEPELMAALELARDGVLHAAVLDQEPAKESRTRWRTLAALVQEHLDEMQAFMISTADPVDIDVYEREVLPHREAIVAAGIESYNLN